MMRQRLVAAWIACLVILSFGSVAHAATLTLAWDPDSESNIAGYVLSYGTQPHNYTTRVDVGNETSYQVGPLAENTTYYFVVQAYNTEGVISDQSEEVSGTTSSDHVDPPTTPSAPVPVDRATGISITTSLTWAASSNATRYDVSLGTANPPPVVSTNQPDTSYQPASALRSGTTYYWQVVAKGDGGNTPGPIWRFTTSSVISLPDVPANPSPVDGATNVVTTIALSWAASANATQYDVSLGTANPPPVVSTNQIGTSYQPTSALRSGTTYYWQVVAKGSGGNTSGPIWRFTTSALISPPDVPSNPAPADRATDVLTTIGLNWAASANATRYDVSLGTVSPPPVVSANQTDTSYQPASALTAGTTYYWRVVAKGDGGNTPSPIWTFVTRQSPPPPGTRRLRLMTWNVNAGKDRNGALNINRQVELMAESGAHVIALQGVTITMAHDLSAEYPAKLGALTGVVWNALWIPASRTLARPEGNLLLSRLPIATFETIDLDPALSRPNTGGLGSQPTGAKRGAGRIAVVVNGVTVTIATTELSADAWRQPQLELLQNWMGTVPAPRLVGGDFNMTPGDPTYTEMLSAYQDAWATLVQSGDSGHTAEVTPPGPNRLDYWWYELTDAHAIPTEIWIMKTFRSNHDALVVDVKVQ